MHRSPLARPRTLALAVSLALLQMSAYAQQAQDTKKKDEDAMRMDQMVVTGTPTATTKIKSSMSISTLSDDQITQGGATNAAEILRAIPGVRSESSGGEGNANITVRGVPISAGGARYVQVQEDGLPVLLFGDIAFGTADEFLRMDYNVDRLEVVRGGSASTLASNSPGGLINFISKTGRDTGGAIGFSVGLDYRQARADFDYGAQVSDTTRMHVGGFYRIGQADGRKANFNAENGGQLKANLTHSLGDLGYVRVSVKALDDKTPTFLPVPVNTANGTINQIPGIDPRTAFFITNAFPRDVTLNHNGGFTSSDARDGLHVKSNAVGLEGSFNLAGGWKIDEKFRTAGNSGRFIGLFPSNNGNGDGTFNGVLFNTSLDNLDNTFNDLKVTKSFDLGGNASLGVSGGLFYGKQNVAQTWYWNTYRIALNGNNPAILGLVNDGTQTFGGCCVRTWDTSYTQNSPYLAVTYDGGPLNLDASVRRDEQKASGYTLLDTGTSPGTWDPASRKTVNYKVAHTSYSVGASYSLAKNMAVFARASDGVAFSADRLLYGTPLDGSAPININTVNQQEVGMKWREGPASANVTLFNARTQESNYEATTQKFTNNKYKSSGIEFEGAYRVGAFRIMGGATYTNAKITASQTAAQVGNKPRRQADWTYTLSPAYSVGAVDFGVALIGTTDSWGDDGNTIKLPGYTVINAFVNYQFNDRLSLSLSANNLFNALGYTEVEGDGHAARAINGRTVRAGVKYTF